MKSEENAMSGRAARMRAMIGVDVLPDQRHFAHAGASEVPHLGDDLFDRARDLRAARVRHDAERAEFVAPFLHGDESRYAAAADRLAAGRRDGVELALGRKLGIDRLVSALGAIEQCGQAMVILRPDHDVDQGRPAQNFLALGLGHAAGDDDRHAAAPGLGAGLPFANAAELRIDLLGRLLADVAGVEDDQLGRLGGGGFHEAFGNQQVRHTLRIVGVHLTAVRLDVELSGFAHAAWVDADPGRSGSRCISTSSSASDRTVSRAVPGCSKNIVFTGTYPSYFSRRVPNRSLLYHAKRG